MNLPRGPKTQGLTGFEVFVRLDLDFNNILIPWGCMGAMIINLDISKDVEVGVAQLSFWFFWEQISFRFFFVLIQRKEIINL